MSAMVKVHLDGGLRAAMIRLRMPVQVDTQDGGSFSGIMVPSERYGGLSLAEAEDEYTGNDVPKARLDERGRLNIRMGNIQRTEVHRSDLAACRAWIQQQQASANNN